MQLPISVIIPTYNRAHTLARALDSVYQQTSLPAEIIVIDDGSTDETQQLITTEYPEVTYHQQINQGVSCSRNRGIQLATSPWVAFLDSDDSWHKKKLSRQFERLQQDGTVLCHTDEIWIKNGNKINQHKKHQKQGGHIFSRCLNLCLISPSSVIIQKELLEKIGMFDPNLPACEDYDLWLRITAKHKVSFIAEKLTIKYGGHADQLSKAHWGMDRFRIIALANLLNSGHLSQPQHTEAAATLIKKSNILLKGAHKHGDASHVSQLEQWLTSLNIDTTILQQITALSCR
jgi:glycosyltransferase involved in cell wall biosynthesis